MSSARPDDQPLSPVKQALLEIRRLRGRLEETERVFTEPVAIVGLGCRFPGGASSPEAFWRLLRDGEDAVTEIPRARWDADAYYDADPDAAGRIYVRHGAFLDAVDGFDAAFFGISPREAASMDPQQRLLLEVGWEALEHAGLNPTQLAGSPTGVFIGISSSDYAHLQAQAMTSDGADAYFATGTVHAVAAGRLSYLLGLRGPAISTDTACSSSLVAVHLACQSLRLGECRTALAGGVNVILWPELMMNFCRARMLSPTGHCHTFDSDADGYVRGEGCGMVVLKRLSDALADGNRVLALIRGSAVNQDGRTSGLTVPNGPAQEALILEALAHARIAPAQISYVEAHGTGTPLGDPIEVRALAAALAPGRLPGQRLAIGSVKTNIGHLEAAAGIAGLIKVVLAMQHGTLPATLHFRTPSPHIPWSELPVDVVETSRAWPAEGGMRLAGVSAFGFSGTNAHVVVQEAPQPAEVEEAQRPLHVLPISARSERALCDLAGQLAHEMATRSEESLADMCFTAAVGRAHFAHRAAVIGRTAAEMATQLNAVAVGRDVAGVSRGSGRLGGAPPLAFMFTGQGPQYAGMGRRLYDIEPAFRAALDECASALQPHLDRPLLAILAPEPDRTAELAEARLAQPAVFAIEVALAAMLRSWGVVPTAVIGHSLGEYAAACVAGVLSLEDSARLVAIRGRAMDALPPGAMAAVWTAETDILPRLAPYGDRLAIAAINAPDQVVVSGTPEAIHAICSQLEHEGIRIRILSMTHAFHSSMVEPALGELAAAAAHADHREPRLLIVSNVTGRLAGPGEIDAAYWIRHARQPVRFADGMATLAREGIDVFVELGPHAALLPLGPQCVGQDATWVPTLRRDADDWSCILETIGALYARGVDIDWASLHRGLSRRIVTLPTYPFQRSRHWLEGGRVLPFRAATSVAVQEAVAKAGQQQATQAPLDLALASYPAKWNALNRLATGYVGAALAELGCFTTPGSSHTLESLAERWSLPPARRHLLARWLDRLVTDGLLRWHQETLEANAPLSRDLVNAPHADARALLSDVPGLLDYIDGCGTKLAAVLTGRESPLETLFPGGSFETTEFLYERWAVARYMNAIARAVVEAWVHVQPAWLRLRVLEVGAGTGGTTAAILPVLPADRTTYVYTDASSFFFDHAVDKFAAYPFLRTRLLDLERDPREQGHEPGSFHLVIAANVLHATRDLDRTLEYLRDLLVPGGMLVAYEATVHHPWFEMSTGLIEGWQHFSDSWRQEHPLLPPAVWDTALRAHGFGHVAAFPGPDSPATVLGQHIITAMVPGLATRLDTVETHADATVAAVTVAADERLTARATELRGRLEVSPLGERHEILIGYVREVVARVLHLEAPEAIDRRARLMDLGIDSLMALDLRKRLGTGLALGRPLPATLVFDHPSIEAIASLLASEMALALEKNGRPPAPSRPPTRVIAPPSPRLVPEEVQALTDEDVEALLLKRLETLR